MFFSPVRWAETCTTPDFIRDDVKKKSRSQKSGLAYERKVVKYLKSQYGDGCIPGQWIAYSTNDSNPGYPRFCQTDAILLFEKRLVVIEVKLTHKPEAEEKLRFLYGPAAQKIWPREELSLVQITKNLEAGDEAPTEITQLPSLKEDYTLIHWRP